MTERAAPPSEQRTPAAPPLGQPSDLVEVTDPITVAAGVLRRAGFTVEEIR